MTTTSAIPPALAPIITASEVVVPDELMMHVLRSGAATRRKEVFDDRREHPSSESTFPFN